MYFLKNGLFFFNARHFKCQPVLEIYAKYELTFYEKQKRVNLFENNLKTCKIKKKLAIFQPFFAFLKFFFDKKKRWNSQKCSFEKWSEISFAPGRPISLIEKVKVQLSHWMQMLVNTFVASHRSRARTELFNLRYRKKMANDEQRQIQIQKIQKWKL